MSYNIKPIPTTYEGVNFRSRLEASWAAFFDLIGWKWEYEPFDLDGWIPDFKIYKDKSRWLLVEIKPITSLDGMEDQINKMMGATEGREVLLLGSTPLIGEEAENHFGWFITSEMGEGMAALDFNPESGWDLYDLIYSYHHRLSGVGSGDNHLTTTRMSQIQPIWKEAKNKTQWRKYEK